jgi:predicted DCC family thiol-disulfide oxidoreductase YuxK
MTFTSYKEIRMSLSYDGKCSCEQQMKFLKRMAAHKLLDHKGKYEFGNNTELSRLPPRYL